MSDLEKVKARLLDLAQGADPKSPQFGLCHELSVHYDCDLFDVARCIRRWPGAAGDVAYPIEGNAKGYNHPNKWRGERGKKRRELCAWMAENVTEEDLFDEG